jgi:hypothetical protein
MKKLIFFSFFLVLFACKHIEKQSNNQSDSVYIEYSEAQLLSFFDSVSNLPQKAILEKVKFLPDSIFKNRIQLNKSLSQSDFELIIKSINRKEMDIKTAKFIFGDFTIDTSYYKRGFVPINLISFDNKESDFEYFAIYFGLPEMQWQSDVFFLKSNKIIAKHDIFHKYGLEIEHFKDSDGQMVVYYKENFESGTGIWWFNFYFYKYFDNQLIPILNVLENGNLQYPFHFRTFNFESKVQNTNPLTLKITYNQQLTNQNGEQFEIINDSTYVEYFWNSKFKIFEANYSKSKINEAKILTYYLQNSQLLFINEYSSLLKKALHNKQQNEFVMNYLNSVKNESSQN